MTWLENNARLFPVRSLWSMAEPNSLALSPVKIDPRGMKEIEQISRSRDLSTFYHVFIHQICVGYCNCVLKCWCAKELPGWGEGREGGGNFHFPRKLIQQFKGGASRSVFNQPLRLFWSKASADHFVKGFIWSPKWIISSSLSSGAWGPGEGDTLLWWYDQCK